jgi:hypothetical protein
MSPSWSPLEAAILAAAPTMYVSAGINPVMSGSAGRAEAGMVVVEGALFVRASPVGANGWIRHAVAQRRGRIRTGTIDRAVRFTPYSGPDEAIDAAYKAKYGDHGGLLTHAHSNRTTLRVDPLMTTDSRGNEI